MKFVFTCLFSGLCYGAYAQGPVDAASVAHALPPVTITAYGQNREATAVPAAVGIVGAKELARYADHNIVEAVNTIPGVRMEERSPGSYRFSIRGSAMRAPFGVRNVKFYYNGIPFSDPSGFTYLNQLGFYNIGGLQIIKGPGGSMYGAGTGGVVLINSPEWQRGGDLGYTAGSYGLQNLHAAVNFGDSMLRQSVRYQHITSDGYRVQSENRKDIISWDGVLQSSMRNRFSVHFLYADLYYQTPGGLTATEYETDARMARPGTGTAPGAVQNKAAIYQKNFVGGFTNEYNINTRLSNQTTLYGAYAQVHNATIRNYSRNNEPHVGGRTAMRYNMPVGNAKLNMQLGAEAQQGTVLSKTYKNKNGTPDTLQADDELTHRQYFGFVQASLTKRKWVAEAGVSISRYEISLIPLARQPYTQLVRDFGWQVSPRVGLLYRATNAAAVYANVSKGFSPPTASELLPSGSAINLHLNAEQGWNYEMGIRGQAIDKRLHYDAGVFYFALDNTIVQRKDSLGGDSYINSGSTQQMGVEAKVDYTVLRHKGIVNELRVALSYTGYQFTYKEFVQVTTDFSGNYMPGQAPHTIAAGVDVVTGFGMYSSLTYYYSAAIWLNDANTVRARNYHLPGAKIGYRKTMGRYGLDVFVGGDNLLDEKYSLGNDVNAAGGRYYNSAMGVNYYAGVILKYSY